MRSALIQRLLSDAPSFGLKPQAGKLNSSFRPLDRQ
jgi:hypothetical protein